MYLKKNVYNSDGLFIKVCYFFFLQRRRLVTKTERKPPGGLMMSSCDISYQNHAVLIHRHCDLLTFGEGRKLHHRLF